MTTFRDLFGIFGKKERLESHLTPARLHADLLDLHTEIVSLWASWKANDESLHVTDQVAGTQEQAIETLTRTMAETREAVAQGIQHVDRSERRIKATVTRARKQLKELGYEDPGLEAESADLQLVDDSGSEEVGVPPVQSDVAEPAKEASSVRGVTLDQLRRVRGY